MNFPSSKRIYPVLLMLVLVVGIFLRTYNFSDWMHFELDQARDAKVVDLAVEHGAGNLPLLGPKAAGSFLRLGPIFYYFEYLGAKIFGDSPAGLASLNLIFSVLAMPLFYLFVRRYFDRRISVILFFIFSTSLFLIMYSRFAWNPNSLPFFVLLTLYALLRSVDAAEKKKGCWLVVGAASLAIASQLHFVALMAISTVVAAFLLSKRPRINWKYWLAAAAVIVFFYIPPIINDIKTGGDNIKEFEKIFIKKSDSGGNSLIEKAVRDYTESAKGYFLMATSNQQAELPKLNQTGRSFDVSCDKGCRANLGWGAAAFIFFTSGIVILIFRIFIFWKREEHIRKDFIILVGLWFGISSTIFLPIAYDFAPRFFLIVAGLPIIFLGIILETIKDLISSKKASWVIIALVVLAASYSNMAAVSRRFSELERAPFENFEIATDVILKERDRTTLEQQYLITDYIENIYMENKYPVYVNSESFYRRAFLYHLDRRGIANDDFRNSQIAKKVYRNGNYFLVYPVNSNLESRTEKYLESYEIVEEKTFGTMLVIRLIPKEAAINDTEQEFGPEKKARSASGVPVRCRWNEILDKCNPDELENEE